MKTMKRGMAAIALVLSLGLVVPSTLGGSALADVSSSRGHNPNLQERVFHCDLDGDAAFDRDYEAYETPYKAASAHLNSWQVENSTTVLVQRLNVDTLYSYYEVNDDDAPDEAVDFADPDVYWDEGPRPRDYPHGKPKGWETVRCTADTSYKYTATAEDLVKAPHLPFVEGVTYLETDTTLYEVTISGSKGAKAQSASADGAPSADRQVKAKKGGKQKGKGKRGR